MLFVNSMAKGVPYTLNYRNTGNCNMNSHYWIKINKHNSALDLSENESFHQGQTPYQFLFLSEQDKSGTCNNIFMRLKRWTTWAESRRRAHTVNIWILWFHFLSLWCSLFLLNLPPLSFRLYHIISIYLKRWISSQE